MAHVTHEILKDQFNEFMDQIGIWVVYTRSDHRFRCIDCYNIDTGDSPADCSTCFGTGYKVSLERWLVYYSNSLARPTPVEGQLLRPGIIAENSNYIFSRATERPVVGDRVFVVEWDKPRDLIPSHGARPVNIVQALRVHFVEPQIAGQVIYYIAHCKFVTEAVLQYEQVLGSTPIRISRI